MWIIQNIKSHCWATAVLVGCQTQSHSWRGVFGQIIITTSTEQQHGSSLPGKTLQRCKRWREIGGCLLLFPLGWIWTGCRFIARDCPHALSCTMRRTGPFSQKFSHYFNLFFIFLPNKQHLCSDAVILLPCRPSLRSHSRKLSTQRHVAALEKDNITHRTSSSSVCRTNRNKVPLRCIFEHQVTWSNPYQV